MSRLPPVAIGTLRTGCARAFGPNGEPSAINKQPAPAPLWLGSAGFAGDEQGDPRHHGGPDKAVHHYPGEHYAVWHRDLPQLPVERLQIGAFGENLSTLGLTETTVCVGDIFGLGGATVQVSQARQPCWKLNLRFGLVDMALRVQQSGRTGWYYRVLKAGEVAPDAALCLLERPCPAWPLARLLHHFYVDPLNRDALEAIAALDALSASWRALAQQRLATGQVEDASRRLSTPAIRKSW